MIFITGGQAQGKTEFAYSFFQDKDIAAADGRCSGCGEALEAELIVPLDCYVLRLMQEGTDQMCRRDSVYFPVQKATIEANGDKWTASAEEMCIRDRRGIYSLRMPPKSIGA